MDWTLSCSHIRVDRSIVVWEAHLSAVYLGEVLVGKIVADGTPPSILIEVNRSLNTLVRAR